MGCNMPRPNTNPEQGFTLIEAVLVIAITGIIAGMLAIFIRRPVLSYTVSEARMELTDTADTALRRMTRDLRLAVPNSIRMTTAGGNQYIEFLLTKTGGRYLAAGDNDPTVGRHILDFTTNTNLNFDMIGVFPADQQAIVANDFIVVNNLGVAPVNAYSCTGVPVACNIATVTSTNVPTNTITLGANPFANQSPSSPSPGSRFQVVTSPVTYVCNSGTGRLERYWGYAIQAAPPTLPIAGASSAVLAMGVTLCNFSYVPGSLASPRGDLIGLRLSLQGNGETVALFHQVHVDNSP
jgi:MSHA biogenesis protein MshO